MSVPESLPPWSAAAERLLGEERERPAPTDADARMWLRLEATYLAPHAPSAVPRASAVRTIAAAAACVGLVVGAVAGYWIGVRAASPERSEAEPVPHVLRTPTRESAVEVPRGVAPTVAPTAAPAAPGSATTVAAVSASAPASGAAPASAAKDGALSSERSLLDRAVLALRRGRVADARAALAEHRSRFSSGQLSEERDALEVYALRQGGETDEAQRAETEFRRRYPASTFLP